jgi:ATP-dependent Clp protease ATP-binding subunit ClpA
MSSRDQRGELFVGRERPRRRLLTVLGDALAGRMRLAMVSGEAGIGKTALVHGSISPTMALKSPNQL